jgi:D-lactate dehydrogenase
MKALFYGSDAREQAYLAGKLKEKGIAVDASFYPATLPAGAAPGDADAEILSVFVDSVVDKDLIAKMPNLKFIATRSTGFDHVDLAAAAARGITVSNVPSYGENTVAEFAFALLLALSRKIPQAYERVRETGSFSFDGLEGFDLAGKTLGVIGTGRIGKHSIRIGNGFGMKVLGFDAHPDPKLAAELNFTYGSLESVLAASDVVTLHVPYMKETHHLMDEKAFAVIKPGAVLINTSRGAVVDTEAMVKTLKSGRLGGAGLDVLEEEGIVKDEMKFLTEGHPNAENLKTALENHILIDLPNVIVTPHNAFNTREGKERILATTVENIAAFVAGKPINLVSHG